MVSKISVEWKCERCNNTTVTDHGKQPEGWVCIYMATPPLHADHDKQGDLCADCWSSLCDWWRQ